MSFYTYKILFKYSLLLFVDARRGNLNLVKELLDYGAEINKEDSTYGSCLLAATSYLFSVIPDEVFIYQTNYMELFY